MAYGTKYTQTLFVPVYDKLTNTYTDNTFIVNAKKVNYSGSSTTIKYYDQSAIVINYDSSGKDDFDNTIHGSSCDWTIYVDQSSTGITEIVSSNYKDWVIEVSGTTGFYWLGYVQPDNITLPFILPYNYFVDINATDGLGDLKNVDYSGYTTGITSVVQAIKYALDTIGLPLTIADQLNITNSANATPILGNNLIHLERFKNQNSNGDISYVNCYDAVGYLLEPYNAILSQVNGYWLIQSKNEVVSNINYYSSDLSSVSTYSFDRSVDVTNNYFYPDSDELSKVAPIKQINLTFNNKILTGYTAMFRENNTTFYNTTGGTKFGDFTSFTNLAVEAFDTFTPNVEKQFYVNRYLIGYPTGCTIVLKSTIDVAVSFNTGTNYPQFRYILVYPNGSTHNSPYFTLTSGTANYNYSGFTFNSKGTHKIIYDFNPALGSNYSTVSYELTNLQMLISYPQGITHDYSYTFNNLNSITALQQIDEQLYYSQSTYPSDVGAILTDNGGDIGIIPVSGWSTYNSTIAKRKFANNTLTGGTFLWSQADDPIYGNGIGWSYDYTDGLMNALSHGGGSYFSEIVYQSGFTRGIYNITVATKNDTSVVGGVNPNISLYLCINSGSTGWQRIQSINLTSGAGWVNKTFSSITVNVDNFSLGYFVVQFGPSSTLNVSLGTTTYTYYNNEYKIDHPIFYAFQKIKRRYRYTDWLSITTYNNQNIFFNSILIIKGKKYEIVGYNYDVVNNQIQLQLAEYTDDYLRLSEWITPLKTIDGN